MVMQLNVQTAYALSLLTLEQRIYMQALLNHQQKSVIQTIAAMQTEFMLEHLSHSLHVLQQIPSWRTENLTQPYTDLATLYQHASQAQDEFHLLLQNCAQHSHSSAIIPAMKSTQRAVTKISTELEGHVERLTDVLRGSMICRDIPHLITTYDFIAQHAALLEVKNRFDVPAASGYRDIKLLVRLNHSGLIAEIQLHLAEIAAIKNGEEHDIYEKIQHIERLAIAEKRPLNDIENMKIKRLQQQSQALYQQAWLSYTQPLSHAS